MNFNQLHYFCVLAQTEHYTNAAKLLSITQPSLTHSIKELEKELGVTLFDKHGRNIKINQYGEFLYEQVKPILDCLDKTKENIQLLVDPTKGTIHLSFLPSLSLDLIPKVMNQFVQSKENEHIHFVLTQGTTKDIQKGFTENEIDIAFNLFIEDDDIISIPILDQELYIAVPLNHPLADKNEIDLIQAAEYPFISYHEKNGLRPIIDDLFTEIDVEPKIMYELADDATVYSFVAANLGIAIVPTIFNVEHFPIRLIKLKSSSYKRTVYLSFNTKKYMSPPVSKFKEFILDTFPKLDD